MLVSDNPFFSLGLVDFYSGSRTDSLFFYTICLPKVSWVLFSSIATQTAEHFQISLTEVNWLANIGKFEVCLRLIPKSRANPTSEYYSLWNVCTLSSLRALPSQSTIATYCLDNCFRLSSIGLLVSLLRALSLSLISLPLTCLPFSGFVIPLLLPLCHLRLPTHYCS